MCVWSFDVRVGDKKLVGGVVVEVEKLERVSGGGGQTHTNTNEHNTREVHAHPHRMHDKCTVWRSNRFARVDDRHVHEHTHSLGRVCIQLQSPA